MNKKFTIFSTGLHKASVMFFTSTLLSASIFAQKATDFQKRLKEDIRVDKALLNENLGTPSLIRLAATSKVTLAETPAVLKQMVAADANTEFRKVGGENGSSSFKSTAAAPIEGIHTEKFQQYFKGIKVQHGIFNALMTGDKTEAYTGEYYDLKNVKTTATITEAQALDFAKAYVGATKYAWEQAKEARDLETNELRKQLYNDAYEKLLPKGELVIVKDYSTTNVSDLSYKFDIYAGAPMSRAWVYVNAHTGKIMLNDKIIKHLSPDQKNNKQFNGVVPEVAFILSGNADAASPLAVGDTATPLIPTRYAGVRRMGVTQVSGTGTDPSGSGALILNSTTGLPFLIPGQNPWVLNDKRFHGVGSNQSEQTYDLNGVGGLPISVPAYGTARSFTDLDNNWTLAEHNRAVGGKLEQDNDDFAFDAHWGAGIVYQYWKDIHGRLSYDNVNSSIKSYVHSGIAYDNAFWNGSVMTYGDGSFQGGTTLGFAPLTSLDVCGHEIGHGVCTFTSDLVYANESGGLNEGYSDVWAAMVENFALNKIDPTLIASPSFPNGFSIWDIGEQIDANDATGTMPNLINTPTISPNHTALRYMDFPGRANNPSSYLERTEMDGSAERWTEQPGCTPSLANDQCGVHNNSGVLNRLMYVLVTGATGTINTRQALLNTAHGADAATDLTPYNVTGIGFNKAEKILYLAELNLTPNATFLQARNACILAAEVLYGKCSFEWKQTIIAWNSVAVGRHQDTALCNTLPKFAASIGRTSITETIGKSNVNCIDAVQNIDIAISILAPGIVNPVTVTITPSGSALAGQDYLLSASTINYVAGETGLKKATISVYNDNEIEGATNETVSFAIHAEDGLGFIKDTVLNLSITDDDVLPVIGAGRSNLLTENFNGTTGNAFPTGWTTIDRLGASTINWITGENAFANGFTTRAAYIRLASPVAVDAPVYDANAAGEVILATPTIDARGKSDLKVKFTFAAVGETAADPANPAATLDFGELLYSINGGASYEAFSGEFNKQYRSTLTATVDSVLLPAFLNNTQFKLGFNWYNDANVALPPGFIVDDVEVTGGTQQIETQLNQGVSEKQFANKDIFYTSANDGQIIARISNNSQDLGCVLTKVSEAGTGKGAQIIFNGVRYDRSKRVVTITPSQNNTTATYNLVLYVTKAELDGPTGLPASSVKVLKIKDGVATSGAIANADVVELTPTFGDFSADGYYTYTLNGLTGFSQFVYAVSTGVLAQKLQSFTATAVNNKYVRVVFTTSEEAKGGSHTIERAVKGTNNYETVNTQAMKAGGSVNAYSFNDYSLSTNVTYQYRLKSTLNGTVTYSDIRFATLTGKLNNIEIAPNPSTGMFTIAVRGFNGETNINVYNEAGQNLVQRKQMVTANAPFTIDLTTQPKGNYTMKMVIAGKTETLKLIVN